MVHRLPSWLRSLQGRLVVVLLIVWLVLVGVEALLHLDRLRKQSELLAESGLRQATVAAGHLSASMRLLLESQRRNAEIALTGRSGPGDSLSLFLLDRLPTWEGLDELVVVTATGRIVGVAAKGPSRLAPGVWLNEPWIREAEQAGFYVSPLLDEDRVMLGAAVRQRGVAAGPALGYVRATFLAPVLSQSLGVSSSATLRVVDQTGRPIQGHLAQIHDPRLLELIRRDIAQRRPMPIQDGRRTLGYLAPVGGTPWSVANLRSDQPELSALQESSRQSFLLTCLVMAVLTLGTVGVLRWSLRPISRLSAAAKRLGSGDLQLRMRQAEVAEFEPLVQAFDQMAQRLEETQELLLVANRQLAEEKEDLDRLVRERTQELEEEHARRLRAERLSTLGLFSSAIAHELRNPLNTLSLSLHWLRSRMGPEPDDRLTARLDSMTREVRRSEQIIRTLLAFARTGEPELRPVDLNALVREMEEVVAPPSSVRWTLDLDPDLPRTRLDRQQFAQVLDNLVRNALQAVEGQPGAAVAVSTRRQDGYLVLEVSDNGPGIPEEMAAQVFEPLVTTRAKGTGLGLALCRRIVEAHGGEIGLGASPDGGARFVVRLPVTETSPDAPAHTRETAGAASP